jgi:periplasmic protein CpxP/Spy
MKILKIFLLLSSLFLFVNADDYKDDKKHKYEHSYKNLDYLELDDIQLKQMKSILIEYKYKYKEYYDYKENQEKKLEEIMKSDSFDRDLYIQTLKKSKMASTILESEKMEKIHKILTPNQRKKFAKYLEEWEIDSKHSTNRR